MSIGDQQAFPVPGLDGEDLTASRGCSIYPVPGMTYRMWLFGKILASLAANSKATDELGREEMIEWTDQMTDMAISRIDAQNKKGNQNVSE
jgi:hypothetical protein